MSDYYIINQNDPDSLSHHGILGQKHGLRRYQYEDGSLTPEGRIRYGVGQKRQHASLADTIHKYRVKKKRSKALEKARQTRKKNSEAKKKAEAKEAKRQEQLKKNYQTDHARRTFQNMDKMSDQEVKSSLDRLRNEQSIRDMAITEMDAERKSNPSKYEKAADFIAKAVKVSGDIATVAENTRKVTDALGITQKGNGKNKGNNNSNNNNQNQNGGKKKKDSTLKNIGKAIENSINQETAARAKKDKEKEAKENTSGGGRYPWSHDHSSNDASSEDNVSSRLQRKLDKNDQALRDRDKEYQTNKAEWDWYNKQTNAYSAADVFTSSLSDISYNINKLDHGKDILEAMGLD